MDAVVERHPSQLPNGVAGAKTQLVQARFTFIVETDDCNACAWRRV